MAKQDAAMILRYTANSANVRHMIWYDLGCFLENRQACEASLRRLKTDYIASRLVLEEPTNVCLGVGYC